MHVLFTACYPSTYSPPNNNNNNNNGHGEIKIRGYLQFYLLFFCCRPSYIYSPTSQMEDWEMTALSATLGQG